MPRHNGSYAMLWDERTLRSDVRDTSVPFTKWDMLHREEWECCFGSSIYYDSVLSPNVLYFDSTSTSAVRHQNNMFKHVLQHVDHLERENIGLPYFEHNPQYKETIVNNVRAISIALAPTRFAEALNV